MPRLLFSLLVILAASAGSPAQNITLRLRQDLSSKMPSGTPFTATDPSSGKLYRGYVITHPARRMLRHGSMILVFTDPVVPVTHDREGVFRGSNKVRLLKLGGSIAAGKLADDAVDGTIGAARARYLGTLVSAALLALQKGGEARLHAGDTIEVTPRRRSDGWGTAGVAAGQSPPGR
ncbi:MAG TPA: hypothetical protein VLC12_15630 [Terriglobales bacterium]|nr:hypothetical protein [Terriglobales bacterium]